ncbi:hypothetical protein GCM10009836_60830 [Pseudonocardia ailaonensis]|uniref:Uncharacterized protein n=1 Tax=Pseudonocardia ailaonensis TaxID=367279 RepID=A0ABN2NJY2_9PSEU
MHPSVGRGLSVVHREADALEDVVPVAGLPDADGSHQRARSSLLLRLGGRSLLSRVRRCTCGRGLRAGCAAVRTAVSTRYHGVARVDIVLVVPRTVERTCDGVLSAMVMVRPAA